MITKLQQIVDEARARGRRRLAVAYGQDSHTLQAVYNAYMEGLVLPTIYGEKGVILDVCRAEGIDTSDFTIINEADPVKCVNLAVQAVATGNADVLMKGFDRQIYARHLKQGRRVVPAQGHTEPCLRCRASGFRQTTGYFGCCCNSDARFQAKDRTCALFDTGGKFAWYRTAQIGSNLL